jgi:hypothetical protein
LHDSQHLVLFNPHSCVHRRWCVGRAGWSGAGALLELCDADVGAAQALVVGWLGLSALRDADGSRRELNITFRARVVVGFRERIARLSAMAAGTMRRPRVPRHC